METRAHYVAVGGFVLTMVALALVAVLWMARASLTTEYAHYRSEERRVGKECRL